MIGVTTIESIVPHDIAIVSHTDLQGIITYANDAFASISGYTPNELIGKSHNILRHPDMPRSLFKNLWETISAGRSWSGYVKNKTKSNGYYWVFAQISHLYDNGTIVGYKSMRVAVEDEKKNTLEQAYIELKEQQEEMIKLHIWVNKSDMTKRLCDIMTTI